VTYKSTLNNFVLTQAERQDWLAKKLAGKQYRASRITSVGELDDRPNTHTTALDALTYAIQLCDAVLAKQGQWRTSRILITMRKDLPYCFSEILCNRDYKPVGSNMAYSGFADYKLWPNLSTNNWPVIEQYRKPDKNGRRKYFDFDGEVSLRSGNEGYLFNDSSAPWSNKDHLRSYVNVLRHIRRILIEQENKQ
jgi:hypothetical protein